jgi:tetratricopeptide (TPR) repeat protein
MWPNVVLVSGHYTKRETDKVQALSSRAEENLNELSHDSDPHIMARSHNNTALLRFENREFTKALRHWLTAYRVLLTGNPPDTNMRTIVRYHIGRTLMALDTTTALPGSSDLVDAQQCLTQEEGIAPDPLASVMAQASLGELAYDAGDFALATTRLTSALADLRHLNETNYTSRLNGSSNQDLVQMQGYIESFLGSALLADGKPDEAELAHQRDLELALDSEDLHAQLRAIRNLAVLYCAVQRHIEAVPLWHEVVEIATVLASQRDLLIAYGGLGTTLHELSIIDSRKGEYQALLAERAHEPRAIFLKQRALAMALGDLESQVLAQRQIVRTYEWPSEPNELEHRLEACDLLVTLSEQLDEATHRADAYRALANAITAQVARLAARGQRFAEAIHVLKAKRNAVLQKFRDVTALANGSKAPLPRPAPFGRVTVLQRRLL